jgi:hypothetical protein
MAMQVENEPEHREKDPGEAPAGGIASAVIVLGVAILLSEVLVPAVTGWDIPDWLALPLAAVVVGLIAWAFRGSRRDERPYDNLGELTEVGSLSVPEPDQPPNR